MSEGRPVRAWLPTVCLCLGVASGVSAQEACEDDELSALAALHAIDGLGPSDLLARARAEGASHPSLHLVTLADDDLSGRAAWLRALTGRGLGPLRCGEALTETSRVVVAVPSQGTIRLDGDVVRVSVAAGFREPVVYVRMAGSEPIAVAVDGGAAQLDLASLDAPLQVQLVATGPDGPRPVAEISLPGAVAETPLPADASLITLLRARSGAGPLRPNRLLRGVAEQHAERVCRSGHVGHDLGDQGDPEDRLRRARVVARHVGEVVARASDVPGAWRALAGSPSHRAAIGDRRFTDVGIGEVEAGDRRCLVVVLAAWPRRL